MGISYLTLLQIPSCRTEPSIPRLVKNIKRQDIALMVIPCLCLSRFSSCTATKTKRPDSNESGGIFLGRHSYALETLTESDGWRLYGLRLLIFPQPLGRALKNQNAVPASAPCFRRRRRSPPLLFESCTATTKKSPQAEWSGGIFLGRHS